MKSLCSLRGHITRRPHVAGLLSARRRLALAAPRSMLCVPAPCLGSGVHACMPRRLTAVQLLARMGTPQQRGCASGPEITSVVMPALSPTMTHGTIASWVKKPGEVCGPGDVLCEIETDKATVSFEVQDECVLAKILEPEGKEVKVGDPVALSVEDEAAYKAFVTLDQAGGVKLPTTSAAKPDAPAPSAAAPAPSPPAAVSVDLTVIAALGDFILSPAARHHLETNQRELKPGLNGTGKDGRFTKGDVLLAIANGQVVSKSASSAKPASAITTPPSTTATTTPGQVTFTIPDIAAAPGSYKETKNTNMRRIIAKRLAESKATVPHAYETVDCEIDAVLAFRKRLQKDYEVNVSVNDVIIRSAALALRDVPEANAFWDTKKSTPTLNGSVDISVAVATPTGLITPIIPHSDRRGLTSISAKMKDLAGRARQGKLKPEEFQGGSFTISNLGMFGIDEFSAVINPPQACIMAVGRGSKRVRAPPYQEGQDARELKPYVSTVMTATLSFDRRVVDEAIAAQFLQVFKTYMSKPELLMM